MSTSDVCNMSFFLYFRGRSLSFKILHNSVLWHWDYGFSLVPRYGRKQWATQLQVVYRFESYQLRFYYCPQSLGQSNVFTYTVILFMGCGGAMEGRCCGGGGAVKSGAVKGVRWCCPVGWGWLSITGSDIITPPSGQQHPPRVNKQAVRMLQECFLVSFHCFTLVSFEHTYTGMHTFLNYQYTDWIASPGYVDLHLFMGHTVDLTDKNYR